MAKLDLSPHKYVQIKKGANRGRKVVDYDNPNAYIRLSHKDHGELYIQKGKLMYADGSAIAFEDTPEWALELIMKQSPEALKEAGYNVKSVLEQLEAKAKEKNKVRTDKKKVAAAAAARAAKAKRGGKKKEDVMPDDPEPEDVGLDEEIEEEIQE
jgi:hypothetical protein